jgi:hypothetical protein
MTRNKFSYSFKNSPNNIKSYDYKKTGEVFKKTLSPALYKNPTIANFLDKISELMVSLIENVKRINLHYTYSVSKDETDII